MAAGLGLLGLPPRAFWQMTPRELASALRGRAGLGQRDGGPVRRDLEALMKRFPDQE